VNQRLTVQQGRMFLKHVVPAVVKPMHCLWHQVIGFLFFCLGIICAFRSVTFYRHGQWVQLIFVASGTLLLLFYGLSSFLKARKISRS
jgi:hypothetical protein